MSGVERYLAIFCGGCCMVVGSTATSLCSPRELGINRTCCSSHGWCGCCCKDSFDEEEHFQILMQKEMERTRDKEYRLATPAETEPLQPTAGMVIQVASVARHSQEVLLTSGRSI
ncbi:hypothetical protein ID866_8015 [Astraeus odoratus]|nr:hypothetical protein ID866_8015 [Astraeus odoratus]